MKTIFKKILPFLDVLLVVLVYPAGYVLKCLRMAGVQRMPLSRMALLIMGVFPIRNHYNDILFIDSSHVIRPHGDVLFEYLQVLPSLNKGVVVHIHDIFSPKNYPSRFLKDEVKFWNEQYLLEAFLTHNDSWEVIGSLNYLHHNYYKNLKSVAPFLSPEREPGSFYIRKIV
jgi:hypothetical protein